MNKNINNHNGKEIHKDQAQKNVKKEGGTKPVDRIRKKDPGSDKEIQPGEPKRAPNIQKSTTMTNQKAPRDQSVSFGDNDERIQPGDSTVKNNQSQVANPNQTSTNGKSFAKQSPAYTTTADNSRKNASDTVSSKNTINTSTYLYVIAAILLVAWVISFFFYKLGANAHMLLALAIIVGIISFLQGRRK